MNSRKLQALETKSKIVNSFSALLEESDFNSITIRAICKHANVSIGSFYTYFKSKDSVLMELEDRLDQIFISSDTLEMDDLEASEKIIELLKRVVDKATAREIVTLKYLYSSYLFTKKSPFISKERGQYITIDAIIVSGQNENSITSEMHSNNITRNLIRFIRGIVFDWLILEGEYDIKSVLTEELERYLTLYKVNS